MINNMVLEETLKNLQKCLPSQPGQIAIRLYTDTENCLATIMLSNITVDINNEDITEFLNKEVVDSDIYDEMLWLKIKQ